jgi:hypothetical protein
MVLGASDAQATSQSILSDAQIEAVAILECARHQAENALSAAYRQADDFLGGTSILEASGLLVRKSAMALSELEVEADRPSIQERERALAKKEADLASQETAVVLREAEAARELERLQSMEARSPSLGSSWRPARSNLRD